MIMMMVHLDIQHLCRTWQRPKKGELEYIGAPHVDDVWRVTRCCIEPATPETYKNLSKKKINSAWRERQWRHTIKAETGLPRYWRIKGPVLLLYLPRGRAHNQNAVELRKLHLSISTHSATTFYRRWWNSNSSSSTTYLKYGMPTYMQGYEAVPYSKWDSLRHWMSQLIGNRRIMPSLRIII